MAIDPGDEERHWRYQILLFLDSWPDDSLCALVEIHFQQRDESDQQRPVDQNIRRLYKLVQALKDRNTREARNQLRAIRRALTDLMAGLA